MKRLLILLIIFSTFSVVMAEPDEIKPFEQEMRYYQAVVLVILLIAILFIFLQGSARVEAKKLDRRLLKKRYRTVLIDGIRDGIFEIVGEHLYNGEYAFDLVGEGDNFPKQFINPETDLIPLSMKNVATGRRAIFITTDTVVDLTNRMGYNPETIVKNILQRAIKEKKLETDDVYKIYESYLENYKHIVPQDLGVVALSHMDSIRKAEARAEKAELKVKEFKGEVKEEVNTVIGAVEKVSAASRPKMPQRGGKKA